MGKTLNPGHGPLSGTSQTDHLDFDARAPEV